MLSSISPRFHSLSIFAMAIASTLSVLRSESVMTFRLLAWTTWASAPWSVRNL